MFNEYLDQGLSVHRGLAPLPDPIDDLGREIPLSECIRQTGIDRSTWLAHMKKWRKTCRKDKSGGWLIRLKSVETMILKYRYGRLGARTGKRWTEQEKSALSGNISHAEAAKALNRSYGSVKTMRCKEKKHGRI